MYGKLIVSMFKVGLFTIGGGLASLPLLKELAVEGGWINGQEFLDMLAVSQSTPGPIGINIATYIGYNQIGVGGALCATLAVILPSILFSSIIAATIPDFNSRPLVSNAMKGFRATALGLIGAAVWFILSRAVTDHVASAPTTTQAAQAVDSPSTANASGLLQTITDSLGQVNITALILFAVIALAYRKLRWHPGIFILIAAAAGLIVF